VGDEVDSVERSTGKGRPDPTQPLVLLVAGRGGLLEIASRLVYHRVAGRQRRELLRQVTAVLLIREDV
jgi:hypothetical protein